MRISALAISKGAVTNHMVEPTRRWMHRGRSANQAVSVRGRSGRSAPGRALIGTKAKRLGSRKAKGPWLVPHVGILLCFGDFDCTGNRPQQQVTTTNEKTPELRRPHQTDTDDARLISDPILGPWDTALIWMADAGVELHILQRVAGHQDPAATCTPMCRRCWTPELRSRPGGPALVPSVPTLQSFDGAAVGTKKRGLTCMNRSGPRESG